MNRDWGTEGWRASDEASVVEKPTTSPLSSSAVASALMPPRFPRSIHWPLLYRIGSVTTSELPFAWVTVFEA